MKLKIIFVTLLALTAIACSEVGQTYKNLSDLKSAQNEKGYLFLGRFGPDWPATITQIEYAHDEIKFTRADGTRHHYPNLDGYEIKLIRLKNEKQKENAVVFRSADKEGFFWFLNPVN